MAEMNFEIGLAGGSGQPRRRSPDAPLRMVVLANLRGAAPREALAQRKSVRLDLDTYDTVLETWAPTAQAHVGGGLAEVSVTELEHFHPDHLFEELEAFGALRDLRARLENPKTFAAAAEELGAAARTGGEDAPAESDDAALDRLLGGARRSSDPAAEAARRMIVAAIAPHIVPSRDPRADELVASVDASLTELMRAVLHAPGVRGLEAVWTGLRVLAQRVELGEDVLVTVLDVTLDEIRADLAAQDDPSQSVLWSLLAPSGAGATAPDWVVGLDHEWGPDVEDLTTLARLGAIAGGLGATYVAGLAPTARGQAEEIPAAFRAAAVAGAIALAAPRVLLRLPYGTRGESVDSFAFEELADCAVDAGCGHPGYLWGNGALACAITRGLERLHGDRPLDLDDLPAHVRGAGDDMALQPCAEVLLRDADLEGMVSRGLVPLASYKDRASIRVPRLQTLAGTAVV